MLRAFRHVNALSPEDAAARAFLTVDDLKAIEDGTYKLGRGEANDLQDAYGMCASCFTKFLGAAKARGSIWAEEPSDD
jgi:hypothetical protein